MGNLNLDLSANKTLGGTKTVLPTGIYNMQAISAEVKETANKKGNFIAVEYKVMDGEHSGKVVIDRFNIVNTNPEAVDIGKNQLKTMITAGGYANPNLLSDTNDIVGLKFRLQLEEVANKWTNNDGQEVDGKENKFKGYFKYDGQAPAKAETPAPVASAPAPTPAPAPASGQASMPWNR